MINLTQINFDDIISILQVISNPDLMKQNITELKDAYDKANKAIADANDIKLQLDDRASDLQKIEDQFNRASAALDISNNDLNLQRQNCNNYKNQLDKRSNDLDVRESNLIQRENNINNQVDNLNEREKQLTSILSARESSVLARENMLADKEKKFSENMELIRSVVYK